MFATGAEDSSTESIEASLVREIVEEGSVSSVSAAGRESSDC